MLRTLFELFSNYYSHDNFGGGEVVVRSILAAVPGDVAALQFLGLVYFRVGRTTEAIKAFDEGAPTAGPTAGFASEPTEDFLSANGYTAAAACHLEATRRSSNLAPAWFDLGLTLTTLGRPRRAIAAVRSALISRPNFPQAERLLGSLTSHIESAAGAAGQALAPLSESNQGYLSISEKRREKNQRLDIDGCAQDLRLAP